MSKKVGAPKNPKRSSRPQNPPPKLPAYLRPQLRLFLTVDIVGSTAFKQRYPSWNDTITVEDLEKLSAARKKQLHPRWFAPIADFYSQTQTTFHRQWDDLKVQAEHDADFKHAKISIGKAPSFWKAIGDEIAFSKRLSNTHEAIFAIGAWIKTLAEVRKLLQEHSSDLDVKSAVWLAGFPVKNTEVVFAPSSFDSNLATAADADDDFVYRALARLKTYYSGTSVAGKDEAWIRDFVGPSIDTGFRIAAKATPRKLMLSIELALLLCHAHDALPANGLSSLRSFLRGLTFRYDGREQFKGVLGSTPYPLLWIDLDSSNDQLKRVNNAEDELSGVKSLTVDQVKNFCVAFIGQHPQYLTPPYICDESDKIVYGSRDPEHEQKATTLARIVAWFENESPKVTGENKVLANPDQELTGTQNIDASELKSLIIAAVKADEST